jgi:D-alanyl-D-alanine carboxypeptidase (penicillin-binding protein 5/6)
MIQPARRLFAFIAAAIGSLTLSAAPLTSAQAQGLFDHPKYAAIVVDAGSGEVLYARRADALRYPASITKVMTLYLTFEALATGRLKLDDQIVMSPHAARQSPTKLGAPAGTAIPVDLAIRSVVVKSANDVAVALGEHLAGSESRFAALMTLRAQELGMSNTRFTNASGLPDSRQVSTARDIAILSRAVLRDYPQYYSYFNTRSYTYRGVTTGSHNRLLKTMPGVDGIKTGYTNAAGYNLAASQVKDGKRLITVVLGGSSTAARDENVADLLDAGFDVLAKRRLGQNITIAANISEPEDISGAGQRPSIEQGSADQPGLRIVLSDQVSSQVRAANAESQPTPGSRLLSAAIAETSPVDAARGRATLAKADVERVALNCTQPKARKGRKAARKPVSAACKQLAAAEDKCMRSSRIKSVKARRASCAAKARDKVELALAPAAKEIAKDTAKPCKGTARACAAQAKAGAREEREQATADTATGKYLIQVGAFKSRAEAQRHLDKISDRYGKVVSSAATQVQSSNGNYRARFKGFTAQEAKQACKALSAKGERCLVMSKG